MRGWRTTRALRTLLVSILLAVVALPAAGAAELDINGYFDDDNSSVHEQDLDSIAAAGITLGCNPPISVRPRTSPEARWPLSSAGQKACRS